MIYTFKVHAPDADHDPLETTHRAHGCDVHGEAKALIDKHPHCDGVEVLMLGSRLFFVPREPASYRARPDIALSAGATG